MFPGHLPVISFPLTEKMGRQPKSRQTWLPRFVSLFAAHPIGCCFPFISGLTPCKRQGFELVLILLFGENCFWYRSKVYSHIGATAGDNGSSSPAYVPSSNCYCQDSDPNDIENPGQ
jgi:hypothetical protein